uniref:hypothetical protein n=1 Tax=Sphingopyxis terrae TaxID=33052 RepID=UPI0036D2500B
MCYTGAIADAAEYLQDNSARIIYGGQIDFRTRQIQPTVLLHSMRDKQAMAEIFSPLFNIVSYTDIAEVRERLTTGYYQDRAMGAMVYGEAPELWSSCASATWWRSTRLCSTSTTATPPSAATASWPTTSPSTGSGSPSRC